MPDFVKSLDVPRIMEDPDILVAYRMNGQALPMLNGYPARLVVPGWYATYWVKNLSEITVIDQVFEKFWMKPGYRIPDNACGCVEPGTAPRARCRSRACRSAVPDRARVGGARPRR